MPLAPLPFQSLAEIALTVVDETHWPSAIEQLISQLVALLDTDAVLLEKRSHQWIALAGGAGLEDHDWQQRLSGVQAAKPALVTLLSEPGEEDLTAISLTAPAGPDLALVLAGDWTPDSSTLKVFALLVSIGLESLRQREQLRAAERRLVAGYAAARRWSRRSDVKTLAQQIVDSTAHLLAADRVSLALYDAGENALTVVATHGYPHADVGGAAIAPGEWVIGQVYARATPVFVRDARLFPSAYREQYRTHAFAALPLQAGRETIGVLAVTDKHDRSAFTPEEQVLLRSISVVAAMAIVAARSTAEAASFAHAATVDSVTQLLNRPHFDSRLHQEIARAQREGTSLAVMIGDIDDFKSVNDSYGHQVGDEVLRTVGGIMRSAVRVFDVCARYGGDEFAILMPNCDRASALTCAERIRERVAQHDGADGGRPRLTMSIGVAVIEGDEDAPALMARADRHLYQAKAGGKNVVRAAPRAIRRAEDIDRETPDTGHRGGPYVLVAGMERWRAESCVEIIKALGIKVSIAGSIGAAQSLLEQSGPPVALIIDVTSWQLDAFALIDSLPEDQTDVVVWAASREVIEYAAARLRGRNARLLSSAARGSVLRAALEKILSRHGRPVIAEPDPAASRDAGKIIEHLVEQSRRHSDAPGVAVYVKAPGDVGFRTSLGWVSKAVPHVPLVLPRAVNRVMETGKAVVLPDLSRPDLSDAVAREAVEDGTRGLVAVPVKYGDNVVGAIAIFDLRPLTLNESNLAALTALGRNAFGGASKEQEEPSGSGFRERATDRRAPSGAPSIPPPPSDFPPAILERTGGEFAVARELARARRERRDLSVVLFDVGPATEETTPLHSSDDRLAAIADTLLRAIRQSDLPIRWTTNELLVVLPGLKGAEARTVAERVRAALQAGARHRVAVSGGVAEIEGEERFADVVDRARQKVALAVGRGHNRVV